MRNKNYKTRLNRLLSVKPAPGKRTGQRGAFGALAINDRSRLIDRRAGKWMRISGIILGENRGSISSGGEGENCMRVK